MLRVSFSNAVYNGSEDVGVVNITIDVFGSTDLPLMVTISTTNGVAKGLLIIILLGFFVDLFSLNVL